MVDVPVILGTDDDRVAFLQFVHVAKRLSVAITMASYGKVADLTRHLGVLIVPQTVTVQLLQRGALHQVAVPLRAKTRDVHLCDQIAIRRFFGLDRRIAFLRLGHLDITAVVAGVGPIHGLRGLILDLFGFHAGPPHLPDDIERAYRSGGQQQFRNDAQHLP